MNKIPEQGDNRHQKQNEEQGHGQKEDIALRNSAFNAWFSVRYFLLFQTGTEAGIQQKEYTGVVGGGEAMKQANGETLYLKIDKNVQVHDERVTIGDIAQVLCTDKPTENLVKTIKVPDATNGKPGRHAMSVLEIMELIQKEVQGLEIDNIVEFDFVVTLEKKKQPGGAVSWTKTIFVAVLAFFGAAFTIMTFNNDVDIPKLFAQIYQQFTGSESDGFTLLELCYSVGIGLGILLFFNHFAGKKFTADPTPLEVEMRTYENEIDTTLIERSRRESKSNEKGR